jgi:hypothetical protein
MKSQAPYNHKQAIFQSLRWQHFGHLSRYIRRIEGGRTETNKDSNTIKLSAGEWWLSASISQAPDWTITAKIETIDGLSRSFCIENSTPESYGPFLKEAIALLAEKFKTQAGSKP